MGKTRDGKKWSKRCDSCIKALLFAIAEFDNKSLAEQLRFWMRMIQAGIPVAALIHSGNKSIHAWIAVYCADAAEWNAKVKRQLFAETLELFGVDPATKNPSRASRLPGARRNGGEFQRLLYLNPQAGRSA
jgi:hypothetical protein